MQIEGIGRIGGFGGSNPIGGIGSRWITAPAQGTTQLTGAVDQGDTRSFGSYLREALAEVNRLQQEADAQAEALALGQVQDLHQVTVAMARAEIALQLTVAVRNRVLEAYAEISRMQV